METLEQGLGRHVAYHRERQRLTVRELSARLDALGHKILPSGITKIEQGTRGVSVDDLLALAKALGVPPLLVLFPVGAIDSVDVLPSQHMSTWAAARWFVGEAPLPGDDRAKWEEGAAPLILMREHMRYLREFERAPAAATNLAETKEQAQRIADFMRTFAKGDLFRTRAEMRRCGMPLPPLPDDLAPFDEPDGTDGFGYYGPRSAQGGEIEPTVRLPR